MDSFGLLFFIASVMAGAIASVCGFGIGSILTPLLALQLELKLAVVIVTIPHLSATLTRLWMVRSHIHPQVLLHFGLASALGGLLGALLHARFHSPALTWILGALLIFSGITGLMGIQLRFSGILAWTAGSLSGVFGGLVGNQGGIRSAALLSFGLPRLALVATATATGAIVDLVRAPLYFISSSGIWRQWDWILIGTSGVLLGTGLGIRFLHGVPELQFRRIVSALILLLGLYLILAQSS